MSDSTHNIASVLTESLPYIQKFQGKTIVIKYGGSAQTSPKLKEKFAEDILLLYLIGVKPVIVHGGGKSITQLLTDLNIATQFIDGQRVTSDEVMKVVEMVLSGKINKEITAMLNHFGAKAIGISGKDSQFITARPLNKEKFGRTGIVEKIDPTVILKLLDEKFIPVIAPIGGSSELGDLGYNINADFVATAVAKSIQAKKILFLTDTAGILDKNGNLINSLNISKIEELKKDNIIYGGMIPKVEASINAIQNGVEKAHIIDGRVEHSILLEILTSEGLGTEITI